MASRKENYEACLQAFPEETRSVLESARERFQSACSIVDSMVDPPRLFYARVTEDGIEELGD